MDDIQSTDNMIIRALEDRNEYIQYVLTDAQKIEIVDRAHKTILLAIIHIETNTVVVWYVINTQRAEMAEHYVQCHIPIDLKPLFKIEAVEV